ncbi:MAG: HU family DNA-binding protein, partial [Chitinophagaceae bacterium]
MRKSDLINQISDKTGIPKVDVLVTLETMFKEVKDSLINGQSIYIRGFGSFTLNHRPSRESFNPKTGKRTNTNEKFIPHFKPGKTL